MLLFVPLVVSDEATVKIDAEVFDELETEDTVDVIVVLDDTAEVTVEDDSVEIKDQDWKTFDDTIEAEDVKVSHTYSSAVTGFAAEVTEEGLKELEENDNVERIYYDVTYTLALAESVPQIEADDVHILQVAGVNLTGAGQAICVVDTGIDYDHADLGGGFGEGYKVVSGYDYCANSDCTSVDADPFDGHGHGTHVAGIAAADGAVVGVAPGANLIAMKVFSASRSTTASKVLAGIDWCVSNATEYNISVITMSLSMTSGGNEVIFTSNSECDDYSDGGVVNASNIAASQGLLVSAAAGNAGNTSGIGSPACGSNVTSVGAVSLTDEVNFNRGPILDLLAPGIDINSTHTDGYAEWDGTSMATPHVAGAAAILFQIASLESVTVTPSQVEAALKDNAVDIYDVDSNYTYSRIDVLQAANSFIYPTLVANNVENDTTIAYAKTLNFSASDISGISTFWYSNGTDELTDVYTDGVDWFFDANLSTGTYDLVFYANDSINNRQTLALTVTISSAPIISDWMWNNGTATSASEELISMDENNTLIVLANVSDVDVGDNITYSWLLDGTELNNTQNLTYDFDINDQGMYNLTLTVSDSLAESTDQTWNLTLNDNYPPTWDVINDTVVNESAWTYDVSIWVNNPDEDTLSYSVTSGYDISSAGVINRTFGCNEDGDYTITATVSDGMHSAADTFDIDVQYAGECASSGDDDDDDDDDDQVFDEGDDEASGGGGGGGGTSNTTTKKETEIETTSTETDEEVLTTTVDDSEDTNSDSSNVFGSLSGKSFSEWGFDFGENQRYVAPAVGLAIAMVIFILYNHGMGGKRKGEKVRFKLPDLSDATIRR